MTLICQPLHRVGEGHPQVAWGDAQFAGGPGVVAVRLECGVPHGLMAEGKLVGHDVLDEIGYPAGGRAAPAGIATVGPWRPVIWCSIAVRSFNAT